MDKAVDSHARDRGFESTLGRILFIFYFFYIEATLRLITGLAGLSQHFQLSCNVSTNVLHHSKPKSHCFLLSEVRKTCFTGIYTYDFHFFQFQRSDFGFSPKSKKNFF